MARISKEKMEEIRSRILDIATESFFENGFEKTSTKALAQKVGIAEGTLFNYFKTKADLYTEVLVHQLQLNEGHLQVEEDMTLSVEEMIADYIKQLYMPMLGMPKFLLQEMMQVLLSISKKNFHRLEKLARYDFKYMAMTEDLIEALIAKGIFYEATDAHLLSETIYGAVFFEFSMFMYKKEMTIDEVNTNIRQKIKLICQGHLV